ncbi:hypothetical protein [Pedobacter arcticus]|uniref:hypothetical protein n=1 Tax=Pedobacter arcticus TaxID=752140 RepID=UPI0002ED7BB3|nr:hypothetical protein [Pedobacter arcticus]
MKKKFRAAVYLLLTMVSLGSAEAQEAMPYVIASSGATANLPGGYIMDFTVGETATSTIGNSAILTQGFHQESTLGALPVALLSFEGKIFGNYNLLSWKTSSENNNSHFLIERSTDENHFISLAKVESKAPQGTSQTLLNYSFNDLNFDTGVNYYRLKQVDLNGKSSYSKIIALQSALLFKQDLWIAPNPITTDSKLYISGKIGTSARAQLLDLSGKLLKEIKISSQATLLGININGKTKFPSLQNQISEKITE